MKRILWLATVSFLLLLPFGTDGRAQAQAKEVAEAVTVAGYVTPVVLPLDQGRYRVNYEAIGLVISDTSSGLFHEATVRVLGQFTIEKNKFNDGQDWGIYTLRNGDKVFFTATSTGELEPGGGGEVS